MNAPRTHREVIASLIAGELDALLGRIEQLAPRIEGAHAALTEASAAFALRIDELTTAAQTAAVGVIVRRTKDVADQTLQQLRADIQSAALAASREILAPELHAMAVKLDRSIERNDRARRKAWAACAALVVATAVLTAAATAAVLLSAAG